MCPAITDARRRSLKPHPRDLLSTSASDTLNLELDATCHLCTMPRRRPAVSSAAALATSTDLGRRSVCTPQGLLRKGPTQIRLTSDCPAEAEQNAIDVAQALYRYQRTSPFDHSRAEGKLSSERRSSVRTDEVFLKKHCFASPFEPSILNRAQEKNFHTNQKRIGVQQPTLVSR